MSGVERAVEGVAERVRLEITVLPPKNMPSVLLAQAYSHIVKAGSWFPTTELSLRLPKPCFRLLGCGAPLNTGCAASGAAETNVRMVAAPLRRDRTRIFMGLCLRGGLGRRAVRLDGTGNRKALAHAWPIV